MSSGRVGPKQYIIPITFDIFKPMWSMCLLHLRSEDIIIPRTLNSDTPSMLIVLIFNNLTGYIQSSFHFYKLGHMHSGITFLCSMTIGHSIDCFQQFYMIPYQLDQFSLYLLTFLVDTMVYTRHMLV